ncbi:MAG: hypothetical protein E7672_02285 [Ruminococcaceae bacterium]|nr:hypothetical protein [Oscillospiraceae bacterium]
MFKKYLSNIPLSTSNNHYLHWDSPRHLIVRGYFRCISYKPDKWRFWYSNACDSTFGAPDYAAVRDQLGGKWKILSARIGDGGEYTPENIQTPPEVTGWTKVTFDGNDGRDVNPAEEFWTDEIQISIPENHYIAWEWEIEGNNIPCPYFCMGATFSKQDGKDFTYDGTCPLPNLFGAEREVKEYVAFLGDSITQGYETPINMYEMWSARVALALGENYAFWNIGLGSAHASDAVDGEFWRYKVSQADTVCIILGVNDILTGRYNNGRGDHADEIITSIEKLVRGLKKLGKRVILFTVPPYAYNTEQYMVWKTLRYAYPALAKELDIELFDFSSTLDAEPPYGNRIIYGAHPNGEGGRVSAEAFLKEEFFK